MYIVEKYDKNYESILNLFNYNKQIKKEEIKSINKFKKIYNLIKKYDHIPFKYDEMVTNPDIRIVFLMESVRIVFENPEVDQNTRDIVLQMYEELYDYLYKDSKLSEIEIPDDLIKNLFNKNIIPDESMIRFIMALIRENKRIFDFEIKGKYFSQMIDTGFHKGITEELKIKEENLSHLFGLTNDGSLYEFYRKTMLDYKIKQILNSLGFESFQDANFDYEQFNFKFKEEFGLDYTEENRIKIINWRYDAPDDYLKRRGISVTPLERIILNQIYYIAPKSNALDFYCMIDSVKLLQKENNEIRDFMFKYIKDQIILKFSNKNNIFTKKELELISNSDINDSNAINLINKYIESKKYKFDEDKNFKMSFIGKFGYSYPLMNYYELLSKNVGFYNFSLFKNLNSIIVDYNSFGKKIESEVFLTSYSYDKMHNIKDIIINLLEDKDRIYEQAVMGEISNVGLDINYINNSRSLLCFPENDRYYFRYGFISRDKQKQDDQIIMSNAPSSHNITLIGFKSNSEEKERLKKFEGNSKKKFKHFLNCETNITANYYQYMTDFIRNGIEYPIDILDERYETSHNGKRKILKVARPLEKLLRYMIILEECKFNMQYNYNNEIDLVNEIEHNIYNIVDEYKKTSLIKISVMKYRLETKKISKENIYEYNKKLEKEMEDIEKMIKYLDEYLLYIKKDNNYENNKKQKKINN